MSICHSHNLGRDLAESKPFGIKVSLPSGDTFNRLLGANWEQFHWYETEKERDTALADMASEHLYSRRGDRPHVVYSAIEASKESDSD
ncbi:MAG: hypothetical protein ACJ0SL_03215 [Candidatus Rariloculaceae bacterium]